MEDRGIKEGENDSRNEADLSGPAGSLVSGLSQLAIATPELATAVLEIRTVRMPRLGIVSP
jgi:hypothetical protein